jgi:hypothetical protein
MEQQSQWKGFMDVLFLGAVGIGNKTARPVTQRPGSAYRAILFSTKKAGIENPISLHLNRNRKPRGQYRPRNLPFGYKTEI